MYIIFAVWPEAELGTPCLLAVKHYMWPSPQSIKYFNSESLCLAFAAPNESAEVMKKEIFSLIVIIMELQKEATGIAQYESYLI